MSTAGNVSLRPPLDGATEPHPDGLRIALGGGGIFYLYPPAERTQADADAEGVRTRVLVAAAVVAANTATEAVETEALAGQTIDEWIAAEAAAMAAPVAAAGADALRAALEPPALSESEEACVQAVRAYLQGFAEAAIIEGVAAMREAEEKPAEPKKHGRRDLIAFTAPPVVALEQAVAEAAAEGRRLRAADEAGTELTPGVTGRRGFTLADGNRRLISARDKAGYMVSVDYADPVASVDEALREIGEYAGLEAVFAVAAACYHALGRAADLNAKPGPIHAEDVLLDIGWQRDRDGIRESRADATERVARLYLRLNGWVVEGAKWGAFTTKDGAELDASSRGPLFTTTVLDNPQGTLTGERRPVGFVFAPGEFLARAAVYPQLLPAFGTYRELARMPRQRPADAWAVSIGLALVQRWRELASHTKVTKPGEKNLPALHMQKMTRRYLLSQYPPAPDPVDVLADKANGTRNAKAYWTKALANLKTRSVIDAETERRLAGEPAKLPRRGWGKAWLDEALDGRPPEGYKAEFLSLAERAETHAKKTRRRRRKPKGDT